MAMLTMATALSIDILLPAFADIRSDFDLATDSTRVALTVTFLFVGIALGMPVYGPLADAWGRKPVLAMGLAFFALGGLGAALAPNLEWLVVSRVVWGFGAAAPRTLSQAMVRDRYDGDDLARVMGLIQTVFFLGPVIAPLLGAALVAVGSWRLTMAVGVAIAVVGLIWSWRIPETLPIDRRRGLNLSELRDAARAVATNRATVGYALALTFTLAGFYSFLASTELLFEDVHERPSWFVPYFSVTMVTFGGVALLGTRLVKHFGAARVARGSLIYAFTMNLVLLAVSLGGGGVPNVWVWMASLMASNAGLVLLIPTANSLALQPMARQAGMAAAVIGLVTMGLGAVLGAQIDRQIDGTVTPLAVGYVTYSAIALLIATIVIPKTSPSTG